MQRMARSCRAVFIACLMLLVLVPVCATAQTAEDYVLNEDVIYWYIGDVMVAKVQQTVFDQTWTEVLKSMNLVPQDVTGYLYSYTVTNLGVWDNANKVGINSFEVDWGFAPSYVANTGTPWADAATGTGPKWTWTGDSSGLILGRTAEGLWAFANTGADELKRARLSGGANGLITVSGQTTGPVVPEPSGLIALATGAVGIFGAAFRKRMS